MSFNLSQRSKDRLKGVHPDLVAVVERAIELTGVDFGVTCGVRTIEEQEANVAAGRSQTMRSKHLPQEDGYSQAVDVVAYVGPEVSWELNLYDDLADAIKEAAINLNVPICWGAAWAVPQKGYPMDIRKWEGTMEEAMNAYIDLRRSEGKRPFIDGPHFELID